MRLHCLSIACLCFVTLPRLAIAGDKWDILRMGADAWRDLSFGGAFGVVGGDTTGELFSYASGTPNMFKTPIIGESFTKFCTTMMLANMVTNGVMSFDDKVNKYVDWWEKDPKKHLSEVTLRHLMTFTSGFTYDVCYSQDNPENSCFCLKGYDECAREQYLNSTTGEIAKHYPIQPPNTTWTYLSSHLQFAGAMALAAENVKFPETAPTTMSKLLHKYLYTPFGMSRTSIQPIYYPGMAIGFIGPGDDIHQLLQKVLTYEIVPKDIMDQVEYDYSYLVSGSPKGSTDGWWGHYGMGNWIECLGFGIAPHVNSNAPLKPRCEALHLRSAPGGSGVYPLWDRSSGGGLAGPTRQPSYFGILIEEPPSLTGLPEYFRIIAKPISDILVGNHDLNRVKDEEILQNLGGLIARDIDYIKSALKNCTCEFQKHDNEPWHSLKDGIIKDDPHKNRNDILQMPNSGVTLRRLINVSQTLGHCDCEGRINP